MNLATAYEVITDRIVKQLEQGIIPWHKPWASRGMSALPRNLVSGKPYRGINVWILLSAGFSSPYFLTYKQAQELGGNVRKGEKGLPIAFWKFGEVERENKETGETEKHDSVMVRYYTVFNVSQCENLRVQPVVPVSDSPEISPIAACEQVVSDWLGKPEIQHSGDRACYYPRFDRVNMPERNSFDSAEFYYSVLFHELGHSTGHQSRLNRQTLMETESFGDSNYSREELVAELTAAYLCGITGIENAATQSNSAAYIQSWLKALKNDCRLVLVAAGQAQKAADLIFGSAVVATSQVEVA